MACYECWWIRYFRSERTLQDFYSSFLGIPLAGAALPVAAFFCLGVYGKVIWALLADAVLAAGHMVFICSTPGLLPDTGKLKGGENMRQQTFFEPDPQDVPLATRMRPRELEEFAGQEHLLGERQGAAPAHRSGPGFLHDFWGPPGSWENDVGPDYRREDKSKFHQFQRGDKRY